MSRQCVTAFGMGFISVALLLAGCTNTQVGSITISPAAQSLTVGQTVQFSATGTIGHGSHPASSENVTDQVTWSSSTPVVATVNSTGLATAVSAGATTISASMNGTAGAIATTTVTGTVTEPITSLSIIPTSQLVTTLNETGQFIAMGTSSAGVEQDVTDAVTWGSSDMKVATVNASGLVTGLFVGTSTISAIGKNPDGTIVSAIATFTESASGNAPQFAMLTVYKVGGSAAAGTVTAAQPGTTTDTINCGNGAGCVGSFPLGATLKLTATPAPGSAFGGWSGNCAPDQALTPSGANSCTLSNMPENAAVGAIFN